MAASQSDNKRICCSTAWWCHCCLRWAGIAEYINKKLTEFGSGARKQMAHCTGATSRPWSWYQFFRRNGQSKTVLSDFYVSKLNTIRHTMRDRLALLNPNISNLVSSSPPPLLNQFRQVTPSETLKLIKNCPMKTSPLDFIPHHSLRIVAMCLLHWSANLPIYHSQEAFSQTYLNLVKSLL